ncbi:amidohydrolase family protein [Clostridium sp. MCC353]|uniref:amidohydrolase family protein n=1 Tax=Clostridium sp. MCC353 TaxID=2592646 RepID=UPI001C0147A5|nr:amidohydrolase family protein [Clostridium sp. MCC353]MBT9775409.1 amidohydrolase family protein [Clostridium sp. MCC353]
MQKTFCDILLHNTAYLDETMSVAKGKSIAVLDGKILGITDAVSAGSQYEPAEIVDGKHLLWMPGLTDGHMHTGQQLLRGKILDALPMIWTRIMLPFESTLTPEMMELSAGLAALEMIKSGTTSFVDAGSYHMEQAAKVYLESGLRGALSHSTMDDPKLPDTIRQTAEEAVASTDRLYEEWNGRGCLKIYYSLRSLISCTPKLITEAFSHAKDRGAFIQAHMNEYPNEINYHLERYQKRPMEYLDSLGVLGSNFVSAHSLLMSENEMDLMKKHHIKAVHCPFSNCGKAAPNTPALLTRSISVGLGTDGTAHGGMSLWNEMKIFRSVMNVTRGTAGADPVIMPAETILSMVLNGGAALMGEEKCLGAVKEGYKADLISINIDQPHLFPTNNMTHTLVESVNAGDTADMMVNGKWIMRERRVLTLDEEKIMNSARRYFES